VDTVGEQKGRQEGWQGLPPAGSSRSGLHCWIAFWASVTIGQRVFEVKPHGNGNRICCHSSFSAGEAPLRNNRLLRVFIWSIKETENTHIHNVSLDNNNNKEEEKKKKKKERESVKTRRAAKRLIKWRNEDKVCEVPY